MLFTRKAGSNLWIVENFGNRPWIISHGEGAPWFFESCISELVFWSSRTPEGIIIAPPTPLGMEGGMGKLCREQLGEDEKCHFPEKTMRELSGLAPTKQNKDIIF